MQFSYVIRAVDIPVPRVHFFKARPGDDTCILACRSVDIKSLDGSGFCHGAILLPECRTRYVCAMLSHRMWRKNLVALFAFAGGRYQGAASAIVCPPVLPLAPLRVVCATSAT